MAPIPLQQLQNLSIRPDLVPARQIIEDFHTLINDEPNLPALKDFIDRNRALLDSSAFNFINNKHPQTGMTALHWSITKGNLEVVQLLMEYGADVYARNNDGLSVAHMAMILKQKAILKLILIESNVDPVDVRCFTHMHAAAMLDDPKYIFKYLEMSGNPNVRITTAPIGEEGGQAGIERDSLTSWPVRAKRYWSNADHVDNTHCYQRSFRGYSPLHLAVENENIKTVEALLIHQNIEVDIRDARGFTAMHLACAVPNAKVALKMVRMLLSRGADITTRTKSGSFPLFVATHMGHKDIVELLLSLGVDPNCWEYWDNITPLHLACRYLMVDIVLALLAAGADATKTDRNLRTPLHWMVSRDWCYGLHSSYEMERNRKKCFVLYDMIIEALVAGNCNINAQDKWDNTAMIAAAICHNSCASSRLQLWDPNLLIRNQKNYTFHRYDQSKLLWCTSCYSIHPALHEAMSIHLER